MMCPSVCLPGAGTQDLAYARQVPYHQFLIQFFTLQSVDLKDINDINIISMCVDNVHGDDLYKH